MLNQKQKQKTIAKSNNQEINYLYLPYNNNKEP
jgi:hypothetical protein